MELLYVIVVVLIAGFLIQRGVKNETPSNSVSTTDFEDSDSQFGNIGMRDITGMSSCRIPDDCIDSKRYPLFMARAVLKELIESLQSIQGVKPC